MIRRNTKKLRQLHLPVLLLGALAVPPFALAEHPAPWVGKQFNGQNCVGKQNPFGPWDYLQRARFPADLAVVEDNHFDEGVETLTRGITGTAMGDIDWVLKAWPNHHRALNSAIVFRLRHKNYPQGADTQVGYPAECYLQRALNFSPRDGTTYMLYGLLLHRWNKFHLALEAYQNALKYLPGDTITQYNMGLTLVKMKRYTQARKVAEAVYSTGFPLPGLKNSLIAAGHWKAEPNAAKDKNPTPPAKASADGTKPAGVAQRTDKSTEASASGGDEGVDIPEVSE